MTDFSIVVPVYNNWWLTERCLRALERLRMGSASFETIVVDNASTDETAESIGAFAWVRYRRHDVNANFAGACNAGAALAQAPLLFFLNNDAYPLGDPLPALAAAFARPEVALAGGALFFEDGVTQAAGLVVLPNAHWHYSQRNLDARLDAVCRSRDALGVSGAAMAVRRNWFLESGGFDEGYVNGFEDVDLCLRARAQGRAVVYVAQARFAHYEAASAGRYAREAENERRFYRRWSGAMASLPRTARGEVGAIAVYAAARDPLSAAALEDLETAMRSFGHPVRRGAPPLWRCVDRRYRRLGRLAWGNVEPAAPGIAVGGDRGSAAQIVTRGAVELSIPWLPCAAPERAARCGLRRCADAECRIIGVIGADPAAFSRALSPRYRIVAITPSLLLGGEPLELACAIHAGRSDAGAFGNVLLAQTGIPAVVLGMPELDSLFAPDICLRVEPDAAGALESAVERLATSASLRDRYGTLLAADARRRFAPRRSAIRVIDLLCAARFGLERPARARRSTPL